MTEMLGKLLLLGAWSALGLSRGRRRRRRAACLRSLESELEALSRELRFSRRPVGDLLERAARKEDVGMFFAACRKDFIDADCRSLSDSWRRTLRETPLPLEDSDRILLAGVGDILGRYDGATQRRAMEGLGRQLSDAAAEAEEEAKRLFRVDAALGITAGLFCVLLL